MKNSSIEPSDEQAESVPTDGFASAPNSRAARLARAHDTFRRWLSSAYDLDFLNIVLAAAAVQQLDGNKVWLQCIGGSSDAKTETVCSLGGHCYVVSTLTSEAALLSATASREKSDDATGGYLLDMQAKGIGVMVLKDFTSILSMHGDKRASIIAAFREVYDGVWIRASGGDGGQTLRWSGQITVISACTSAYDRAYSVIAEMGDRFMVVRLDDRNGRKDKGRQALRNVGHEVQMRAELAVSVDAVLTTIDAENPPATTPQEDDALLDIGDLATIIRTPVEYDGMGMPAEAHSLEQSPRFTIQLKQLVRGGLAIGLPREAAMRIAMRCAADSVPQRRLKVLLALLEVGRADAPELERILGIAKTTIKRSLRELQLLRLVEPTTKGTLERDFWRLSDDVDVEALRRLGAARQEQSR